MVIVVAVLVAAASDFEPRRVVTTLGPPRRPAVLVSKLGVAARCGAVPTSLAGFLVAPAALVTALMAGVEV